MGRLLETSELPEFQELIQGYQPNPLVLEQFQSSHFAAIAGPAGAGKDTLRDALLKDYPDVYLPVISTTTRPARPGEANGLTYHFREVEEIRDGLRERIFFQAALVHNQQISCLDITEITKLGPQQTGLSILIPPTIEGLRTYKLDLKAVFLVPPTFDILINRMQAERKLSPEEIDRRLEAAKREMLQAYGNEFYFCIVSDNIADMTVTAHAFFQGEMDTTDSAARLVLGQVLQDMEGANQI
jgi:guanylate kinase